MTTIKNPSVKEVMSKRLKTLHPKDTVKSAKELFDQYDIHHLPVQVMGELKGILSLGDLLYLEGITNNSFDEFVRKRLYKSTTVDEVMTARPYCIEDTAPLSEALDVMLSKGINCLPVKSDDKLVGIITSRDMIKYLRKNLINI